MIGRRGAMGRTLNIGSKLPPDGASRPGDRGIAARLRFYEALWHELARRGYRGLTVAGVARDARRSRGCFYHHFRDLHDLVVRAYRAHTESTLQFLRTSIEAGRSVQETLVDDVVRLVRGLGDLRMLAAVVELHLAGFRDETVRAAVRQDYERKTQAAARLIRLGIRRGEFRRDCDPVWEGESFYATCFGLYHVHLATRDERDLAVRVERHLHALLGRLRA